MSEYMHVIYQSNQKGLLLKDMTLIGGVRLNCKGFKANSLMSVVFAKRCYKSTWCTIGVNLVHDPVVFDTCY